MSDNYPKVEPVVLNAPSDGPARYEEVRLPLTEKELARERLRAKVDVLTETASLKGQMQMEPLKMLGGASAVGAVLGLVLGSQMKRTKKIYVDANSPVKYQKALMKAQQKEKGADLTGGLVATLMTVGVRALSNRLVRDRLHSLADDLLTKAGQPTPERKTQRSGLPTERRSVMSTTPTAPNPAVSRFLKQEGGEQHPLAQGQTAQPQGVGAAATSSTGPITSAEVPGSQVEAKAEGAPIEQGELRNPNS